MFFKKNILFALCLLAGSVSYGQSDIFLSQQWFSRINMNPAATGNSNNVNLFLLSRQQWVGFSNAPRTNILNAHTFFNSIQSGLGFSLIYDKLGRSHQTVNGMLSYAYHIDLTDEMLLSMGLAGGIYNSNWDPNKHIFGVTPEPDDLPEKTSRTAPDFHTGIELNAYGITFGASVTHLLNTDTDNNKPGRRIYTYMRYRTVIDWDYEIAPAVMYRYGNYSHFFDLNVMGFYQKKYWLGLSFRPANSFAVQVGAEFYRFRIGYCYDRSIGKLSKLAANTHEIMLSARIQKPQQSRRTTRFLD